jgi:hypothetical protein
VRLTDLAPDANDAWAAGGFIGAYSNDEKRKERDDRRHDGDDPLASRAE